MSLDPGQRRALLGLARDAIAARLENRPPPRPTTDRGTLGEPKGAFVTLTINGIHLTAYGYWAVSRILFDSLIAEGHSASRQPWRVRIDAKAERGEGRHQGAFARTPLPQRFVIPDSTRWRPTSLIGSESKSRFCRRSRDSTIPNRSPSEFTD